MKCASDFRAIARDALKGRWGIAVIAGLLASLLGGIATNGPQVKLNISDNGASVNFMFADQQVYSTAGGWIPELNGPIYMIIVALAIAAVVFILGSVIALGYSKFNLELVDCRNEPQIGTVFSYFPHWKNTAVTHLLRMVYVMLWSLLLIIPGIIASYSYAMIPYILAENPEMSPKEAIARSKEMMYGNRWRLFCLHFSFIGWAILSAFTKGIGNLWLTPYQQTAVAAFYREVSGTEYVVTPEPVAEGPEFL